MSNRIEIQKITDEFNLKSKTHIEKSIRKFLLKHRISLEEFEEALDLWKKEQME